MKTFILAGGLGTRMGNLTRTIPKPMVKVNGEPLLDHIMKFYLSYNYDQFYLLTGYKSTLIRKYYKNRKNIKCIHSGVATQTAGRILAAKNLIDSTFFCTYGDGVCDIDLRKLLEFHNSHGKIATLTAIQQPNRFGVLHTNSNCEVVAFDEKPFDTWISGGFFIFEPSILNYINGPYSVLETDVFPKLAKDRQLVAYHHQGFWKRVDTPRDVNELTQIYKQAESLHKGL